MIIGDPTVAVRKVFSILIGRYCCRKFFARSADEPTWEMIYRPDGDDESWPFPERSPSQISDNMASAKS